MASHDAPSLVSSSSIIGSRRSFSLTPGLHEGADRLKILVCSCNIGNAMPTDLSTWIPKDGGHHDVIAIGMQESTFRVKMKAGGQGETEEELDDDDDDDEEEALDDGTAPTTAPVGIAEESILNIEDVSVASAGQTRPHRLESIISAHQFDTDGTGYLKDLLLSHLGDNYVAVGSVRRMQMRLRVYVHKDVKPISEISTGGENTGIGSIVANKGGLAVSLRVGGTSLCFVSCHLAAHEGERYAKKRNHNVNEILNGAHTGNRLIDLDHQHHHVFFFGDLNYRLDPSMSDTLKELPWIEQRERVMELIKSEQWSSLNAIDELQRELLAGRVLCGFQTSPCDFPPTFKAVRRSVGGYNEKRMPSYCDRVLWKSQPGLEKRLELAHYTSCPNFLSSDHKPIRASYYVSPTPPVELDARRGCVPKITFSELQATGLPVMDVELAGATTDPYLVFLTDPTSLLLNRDQPRTSVIHRSLDPVWTESVVLLPAIQKKTDTTGARIIVMAMDWDFSSADDTIGFASLSLDEIRRQSESSEKGFHAFELELVKGGLPRGWVKGKARLQWPKDGERFKESMSQWECKCLLA